MHKWTTTDKNAFIAIGKLVPFLSVKLRQANTVMLLRRLKETANVRKLSYWYEKRNPQWSDGDLVTTMAAAEILGYKSVSLVYQAVKNGTLLSLSISRSGSRMVKRIPEGLCVELANLRGAGKRFVSPPEFVDAQHAIYEAVAGMNSLGVNGTCVTNRTGIFTPAG